MGGDFFAGKLDTAEWRLALAFTFCALGPGLLLREAFGQHRLLGHGDADFFSSGDDGSGFDGVAGGGGAGGYYDFGGAAARLWQPYAQIFPLLFLVRQAPQLSTKFTSPTPFPRAVTPRPVNN